MVNSKSKIIYLFIIIVAVAAGIFLLKGDKVEAGKYDAFAQCLADKKVTMYGAYWCVHCQNEKAAFGDSFKFVPYVECTEETQKCTDAGVKGFPTWIFPDGRKFEGEQGLAKLSQQSGCQLPQ